MTNFIHTWEKKLPDDICDQVIEIFDDVEKNNPEEIIISKLKHPRKNMQRNDLCISLDKLNDNLYPNKKNICDAVYSRLKECYLEYTTEYGQLPLIHKSTPLKVQKTLPQGGFHSWHYDQAGMRNILNELVWMIYLNTMPLNEAETEFLYQSVKIQPQKGMVCIFPATMTHVHRGLTVYTQPKYIITGAFYRVNSKDNIEIEL